ncbi:MAG: hypothetical protein QXF82_05670 [Nitrososphaeria archaeon]
MNLIKKLTIVFIILSLLIAYLILYTTQEDAENLSLDLYELHAIINDNGTITYKATLRVDNLFGKRFKLTYVRFLINNTIIDYNSLTFLPNNGSGYIIFSGVMDNERLKIAIEDFNKLDVKIKVKLCNENDIAFQGSYSRLIKLYLKTGVNQYYFTKFDMFGINA